MALLGPEERRYSELRLLKEAKEVFETVTYFPISKLVLEFDEKEVKILYRGKNILEYDALLPRIPKSYMKFGYLLLCFAREQKIPMPISPESVLYTHNKFLTLIALAQANVPIPKTYLSLKRATLEKILENIKYPVVLKLLYGCAGKGVMFADSKESAISIMDMLEAFKQPVFVEEFIKNPGEDIRAFVIGEELVACMKRKAKKGERRANIAAGGIGEKYEAGNEEKDLALRAAKALGMKVAAVDILPGKKKYVIEVNVYPGLKGIENATGINVARKIVEKVYELAINV